MFVKTLAAILAVTALFVGAQPALSAGVSYIVTLTNGNTLEANSYREEGDTVYLVFPVGEAAVKKSQVSSIVTSGGEVKMFQSKGDEQKTPERPEPATTRPVPEQNPALEPVPTIPGPATLEERRRMLEKRRETSRPSGGQEGGDDSEVSVVGRKPVEDPNQEEINELVDDYFEAGDDEEKLDELDNKLDKMFE